MTEKFSHFDDSGRAKMVDVSEKPASARIAIARGQIHMQPATLEMVREKAIPKGDVFTVAQLAGVMAAKRTAELIPLCHPLSLSHISVELELDQALTGVNITAIVKTVSRTGVEMEALMAVSMAALTIYDMVKAVDKTMRISDVRLVEKHGGQSGDVYND